MQVSALFIILLSGLLTILSSTSTTFDESKLQVDTKGQVWYDGKPVLDRARQSVYEEKGSEGNEYPYKSSVGKYTSNELINFIGRPTIEYDFEKLEYNGQPIMDGNDRIVRSPRGQLYGKNGKSIGIQRLYAAVVMTTNSKKDKTAAESVTITCKGLDFMDRDSSSEYLRDLKEHLISLGGNNNFDRQSLAVDDYGGITYRGSPLLNGKSVSRSYELEVGVDGNYWYNGKQLMDGFRKPFKNGQAKGIFNKNGQAKETFKDSLGKDHDSNSIEKYITDPVPVYDLNKLKFENQPIFDDNKKELKWGGWLRSSVVDSNNKAVTSDEMHHYVHKAKNEYEERSETIKQLQTKTTGDKGLEETESPTSKENEEERSKRREELKTNVSKLWENATYEGTAPMLNLGNWWYNIYYHGKPLTAANGQIQVWKNFSHHGGYRVKDGTREEVISKEAVEKLLVEAELDWDGWDPHQPDLCHGKTIIDCSGQPIEYVIEPITNFTTYRGVLDGTQRQNLDFDDLHYLCSRKTAEVKTGSLSNPLSLYVDVLYPNGKPVMLNGKKIRKYRVTEKLYDEDGKEVNPMMMVNLLYDYDLGQAIQSKNDEEVTRIQELEAKRKKEQQLAELQKKLNLEKKEFDEEVKKIDNELTRIELEKQQKREQLEERVREAEELEKQRQKIINQFRGFEIGPSSSAIFTYTGPSIVIRKKSNAEPTPEDDSAEPRIKEDEVIDVFGQPLHYTYPLLNPLARFKANPIVDSTKVAYEDVAKIYELHLKGYCKFSDEGHRGRSFETLGLADLYAKYKGNRTEDVAEELQAALKAKQDDLDNEDREAEEKLKQAKERADNNEKLKSRIRIGSSNLMSKMAPPNVLLAPDDQSDDGNEGDDSSKPEDRAKAQEPREVYDQAGVAVRFKYFTYSLQALRSGQKYVTSDGKELDETDLVELARKNYLPFDKASCSYKGLTLPQYHEVSPSVFSLQLQCKFVAGSWQVLEGDHEVTGESLQQLLRKFDENSDTVKGLIIKKTEERNKEIEELLTIYSKYKIEPSSKITGAIRGSNVLLTYDKPETIEVVEGERVQDTLDGVGTKRVSQEVIDVYGVPLRYKYGSLDPRRFLNNVAIDCRGQEYDDMDILRLAKKAYVQYDAKNKMIQGYDIKAKYAELVQSKASKGVDADSKGQDTTVQEDVTRSKYQEILDTDGNIVVPDQEKSPVEHENFQKLLKDLSSLIRQQTEEREKQLKALKDKIMPSKTSRSFKESFFGRIITYDGKEVYDAYGYPLRYRYHGTDPRRLLYGDPYIDSQDKEYDAVQVAELAEKRYVEFDRFNCSFKGYGIPELSGDTIICETKEKITHFYQIKPPAAEKTDDVKDPPTEEAIEAQDPAKEVADEKIEITAETLQEMMKDGGIIATAYGLKEEKINAWEKRKNDVDASELQVSDLGSKSWKITGVIFGSDITYKGKQVLDEYGVPLHYKYAYADPRVALNGNPIEDSQGKDCDLKDVHLYHEDTYDRNSGREKRLPIKLSNFSFEGTSITEELGLSPRMEYGRLCVFEKGKKRVSPEAFQSKLVELKAVLATRGKMKMAKGGLIGAAIIGGSAFIQNHLPSIALPSWLGLTDKPKTPSSS